MLLANVENLARILECEVSFLLMQYLGLSLDASFKNKAILFGMHDRKNGALIGYWKNYLLVQRGEDYHDEKQLFLLTHVLLVFISASY